MKRKHIYQNNRYSKHLYNKSGFSLIELIVVIVILGVLATGISTFINLGSQIYSEATDRDHVVSSARFAIERINREIRTAVPNSIRINANTLTGTSAKQCIEFTPIVLSAIYTEIPVAPESASDKVNVITFDEVVFNNGFSPNLNIGVYILNDDEFYGGNSDKVFTLLNEPIAKSGNEWTLTLAGEITFAEDSPTNRLYFFNKPISYCVQNSRLTRHENYTRDTNNTPTSSGVLMAENITMHNGNVLIPPFWLTEATQLRNSMVLIKLAFTSNLESIVFNNEIQVYNVL